MTRLIQPHAPLQVRRAADGAPAAWRWQNDEYRVTAVLDAWRIERGWWDEHPVRRDHYTVTTDRGLVCDLYWDWHRDAWFLERIHD